MSPPADPLASGPPPGAGRPLVAVALVLALVAGLLAVTAAVAPPALALHQHCGDDLEGTFSQTNGHPLLDADDGEGVTGWSGQEILQRYARALQGVGFARTVLGDVADNIDAASDLIEAIREAPVTATLLAGTPVSQAYAAAVYVPAIIGETALRIVLLTVVIANIALLVAETVLMGINFQLEVDVADENACGGTLGGDALTMTWVATVQRHLASSGPPLAMLMAPHDPELASEQPPWPVLPRTQAGDFTWCPDIPAELLTGELPAAAGTTIPTDGGDCTSAVQLGWLDAPSIGVQAIVTNTITHLDLHGVDVRGAADVLALGDTALDEGRYSDAFHHYRAAYQLATAVTAS
jgi:hypothetical protein